MIDGKRYLVVKKQENDYYAIKLAYWFDERVTKHHIYVKGFYRSKYFYCPHKNIVAYVDLDNIPKFTKWKMVEPVEGERYLVYRVGSTCWYSPHYTIRKYHNGSFGSKDVKYWIKLSEVMKTRVQLKKG